MFVRRSSASFAPEGNKKTLKMYTKCADRQQVSLAPESDPVLTYMCVGEREGAWVCISSSNLMNNIYFFFFVFKKRRGEWRKGIDFKEKSHITTRREHGGRLPCFNKRKHLNLFFFFQPPVGSNRLVGCETFLRSVAAAAEPPLTVYNCISMG